MDPVTRERLFGIASAFDHPAVRGVLLAVGVTLLLFPILVYVRSASHKISQKLREELWARYFSWLVFIPMMFAPILLGAACTIVAVGLLALLCYREFARATGLFRFPLTSATVVIGIILVMLAAFDHWYGLFVALTPLVIATIAMTAIISDQPKGYIQRVALGIFAFLLFGVCYGHLAYFANDTNYRAILVWLIVCIEMNDIFAFISGKSFGHRKLAPNTSPNKTIGGALGALVLTTALASWLGHYVFAGTALSAWPHLLAMGAILSITGQLGDLTLSSIKRDLGIKDWANTFPGHGGLLDRFNSLLFAAPAIFYYIVYFVGIGQNQVTEIFSAR